MRTIQEIKRDLKALGISARVRKATEVGYRGAFHVTKHMASADDRRNFTDEEVATVGAYLKNLGGSGVGPHAAFPIDSPTRWQGWSYIALPSSQGTT